MPAARPTCLVTGFEPFDGDACNPSALIARALHGQVLRGVRVQAVELPCTFAGAIPALQAALREHQPGLVLALGQAGRSAISLERVALNVDDARIPDNEGAQPIDLPVRRGAPAAYFSTLPIKAIVAALRKQGLAAEVSQTAGTFVCNHLFYGLMHSLRRRPGVRGGFMHVPMLPAQAAARGGGAVGMPLDEMIRGTQLALKTALVTRQDLAIGGGRID